MTRDRAIAVATANIGDANSARLRANLERIRDRLTELDAPAVLCLQEINDNDKRRALVETFAGWSVVGIQTHCPILVHPDLDVTRPATITRTSAPIKRLTPARVVVDVILPDVGPHGTAIVNGHFPRAYNAPASLKQRPALIKAWWVHRRGFRARIRHHRAEGRDVAWASDTNLRPMPPIVAREGALQADGVDVVRAAPARGRVARRLRAGVIDLDLEPWHDCPWAVVRFIDADQAGRDRLADTGTGSA